MATVDCPQCGRVLDLDEEYRDWTVRCPHCEREFVPASADGSARRPREEEDEDEDGEPEYGVEREEARERALPIVAAPAIWLEICGWGGAFAGLGLGLLLIVIGLEEINNPPPNANNPDGVFNVFVGCCLGVFAVPYSVAMALGARHMRHIGSRGWAMAGAILGIASFAMFGIFGLIQAAIGTWALLTLDKPVVRRAFGLPPRHRPRDRDE